MPPGKQPQKLIRWCLKTKTGYRGGKQRKDIVYVNVDLHMSLVTGTVE